MDIVLVFVMGTAVFANRRRDDDGSAGVGVGVGCGCTPMHTVVITTVITVAVVVAVVVAVHYRSDCIVFSFLVVFGVIVVVGTLRCVLADGNRRRFRRG